MIEKQSSLSEKANAAMHAVAAAVIERAKQTATPIVVWENGRVKEIPSDQFKQSRQQTSFHIEGCSEE